jgi:hypothetical protein
MIESWDERWGVAVGFVGFAGLVLGKVKREREEEGERRGVQIGLFDLFLSSALFS